MKLSTYARQIGVTYKTAHRWWKAGRLPIRHARSSFSEGYRWWFGEWLCERHHQ